MVQILMIYFKQIFVVVIITSCVCFVGIIHHYIVLHYLLVVLGYCVFCKVL